VGERSCLGDLAAEVLAGDRLGCRAAPDPGVEGVDRASSSSARSKSKTAKFSAIRDGVTMLVYTAEPDSPAAQALDFLASWATAQHPVEVDESSPRQGGERSRSGRHVATASWR